jgi:uncharacterized MnhB-related membrane protein
MIVDGILAALLLILAGGAIFAQRLLGCVLLFIVFGLLLSLSWVRLQAVDLALAEAAIGAGLTGALLLYALMQTPEDERHELPPRLWITASCITVAIATLLLQAVPEISQTSANVLTEAPANSAAALAQQQLERSGVSHPVTAVLLNFRAWDTLLELAVVVLALVSIRQLQPGVPELQQKAWPLLLAWSQVLAPVLFVVAAFLLWRGKFAPGGAFQAGALLAAALVLLRLSGVLPRLPWSSGYVRCTALLGLVVFVAVTTGGFLWSDGWLHYPPQHSGTLILLIEVAATVSIALALALMIVGEEKDLH